MTVFCVLALLLALGTAISYRLSAPVSARKRAFNAMGPLRNVQLEISVQARDIRDAISKAVSRFIQDVLTERLRAMPIDNIKSHASGMRLQALKDVGLRTVLDLQGWDAQRLAGIRGVGPKSAGLVAGVVQKLTRASNSIAVLCPSPPLSRGAETALVQSIYLQLFFEAGTRERVQELESLLNDVEGRLSQISSRVTFSNWMMSFAGSDRVSVASRDAEALRYDLENTPATIALMQALISFFAEFNGFQNKEVTSEKLVAAWNGDPLLYDWLMAKALGHPSLGARPESRQMQEPPSMLDLESRPSSSLKPPGDGGASSAASVCEPSDAQFDWVAPGPTTNVLPPPPKPVNVSQSYAKTATEAIQQLNRLRAERDAKEDLGANAVSPLSGLREELTVLQIGRAVAPASANLRLPGSSPVVAFSAPTWIVASDTVTIQGVTISGSYFYFGSTAGNSEFFILDPTLPAIRGQHSIVGENAFDYRYGALAPETRFRYLEWLSLGASDREVPSGFGKMYFQGLERRLLRYLKESEPASSKAVDTLLEEVRRIDSLFIGNSASFGYHVRSLLQFFAARAFVGGPRPILPISLERHQELPFELRLGLGFFMKEAKPIPAEWALRWARVEPTIYLRTAALRCPAEFEAAFLELYSGKYGDGMLITPNKTVLSVDYQPMWSGSDNGKVHLEFCDLPDVKALTAPQSALAQLVAEATEMIDAYSRLLGPSRTGAGTLEAMLHLPGSIWPQDARMRLERLRSTLVEPMTPTTCEAMFNEFEAVGEITPGRVTELATNLRSVRIGFEPDVLAGARRPKSGEFVVLFPLSGEFEASDPSSAQVASLAVALASIVALADGRASEEEAASADSLIARWDGIAADLRTRLRAVYRLSVRQPPSLASLRVRVEALSPDDRKRVASALSDMAASDGVVSPEEVKLLERVYRTLAIESQTLYADLHSALDPNHKGNSAAQAVPAGHRNAAFLDPSRLQRLRQQSSQVSEILAEVFADGEESITVAPPLESRNILPTQAHTPDNRAGACLPGLTPVDQHFVALLISKSSWSRQELLHSASQMQIMLDGTLERINEAALDHLGQFLIEGDDPIYVEQTLLEAVE